MSDHSAVLACAICHAPVKGDGVPARVYNPNERHVIIATRICEACHGAASPLVRILVNGVGRDVVSPVSYNKIVALANVRHGHSYTITVRGAAEGEPDGTLRWGEDVETVAVKNGTVFNVVDTGVA